MGLQFPTHWICVLGCDACGSKETLLARMVLSHMAHGSKTKAPFEPTLVVWLPTLVVWPRIRRVGPQGLPTGVVRFLACTDKSCRVTRSMAHMICPVVRLKETCRELSYSPGINTKLKILKHTSYRWHIITL